MNTLSKCFTMTFILLSAVTAQAGELKELGKSIAPIIAPIVPAIVPVIIGTDPEKAKETVADASSDVKDAVTKAAEQTADAAETAVNQTGDALETAGKQIGAEAERAVDNIGKAHQTAKRQLDTNLENLDEWLAKQERSFCRFMSGGADEQCMEQGIEGSVDNKGNVTVGNPTTGETFQVNSAEDEAQQQEAIAAAAEAAEKILTFRIMQPTSSLANSPQWRKASRSVGAEGIYAWELALDNLPDEVANNPELQALWLQVQSASQAANIARNSGNPRPIVLVAGFSPDELTAGEAVKKVYDAYNHASIVWDVMMGTYKFSYVGFVADVVSPETISPNSDKVVQVPGLYPEEKAAIDAGKAYYNALPQEIRLQYEHLNNPPVDQPQLRNPN